MTQLERFKNYTLDKSAMVPLYFQIKNLLQDMLCKGYLSPGDMIPTEYELCDAFLVSRTTVRQALTELVDEGIFYRVKGRGTFVAQSKIRHNLLEEKVLFTNGLINKGLQPKTVVIELKTIPASIDIAGPLKIPVGSDVISLKRIRIVNDEPIYSNHTYMPYSLCKNIIKSDFNEHSLFKILSQNTHTKLAKTEYNFESVTATKEDCSLLNISKITAIQMIQSISFNKFEIPIKYSTCRYRGDKNVFTIEQDHE